MSNNQPDSDNKSGGYSGKPLVTKLGIKPGYRLFAGNQPDNYMALVAPLPDDVTMLSHLSPGLDMIHFFTTSRRELEDHIRKLVASIKPNGMIWVSWPKRASKISTDLTEDVIREIALPLGLVDVKVCSVDATWSGLKLVIRKEKRR